MTVGHFWVQNGPFAPKVLLEKSFMPFSFTYKPFQWEKFWKVLTVDPYLGGCTIFRPKMGQFAQMNFFSENLFINLVLIILAYLHSKNQNPDINVLMKYWQLKNTEILLAKSRFWS